MRGGDKPPMTAWPGGRQVGWTSTQVQLYGGGEWLVVGDGALWAIQGNGADGDTWAANNLPGAIAAFVPLDPGIAGEIERLAAELEATAEAAEEFYGLYMLVDA